MSIIKDYIGAAAKEVWRYRTILRNPYFFKVESEEVEEEVLTASDADVLMESNPWAKYENIEKEFVEKLKSEGYDSVVFYYHEGVHNIPSQVAILGGTAAGDEIENQLRKVIIILQRYKI